MEETGILDKLESLQQHDSTAVYEKCVQLLHKYFEVDDDEND